MPHTVGSKNGTKEEDRTVVEKLLRIDYLGATLLVSG
jgi:hypothetical protein